MKFWDKADLFAPVLVRLLARRSPGGPPLTNAEIAELSGLSVFQIAAISQQVNWTGIDLATMRRFLAACGLDLEDAKAVKRARTYLRGKVKNGMRIHPRFSDFQRSPQWETEFRPLAEIFLRHANRARTGTSHA